MCKIGDFSSLFEIAFGLSVLFWYFDARNAVVEKMEEVKNRGKAICRKAADVINEAEAVFKAGKLEGLVSAEQFTSFCSQERTKIFTAALQLDAIGNPRFYGFEAMAWFSSIAALATLLLGGFMSEDVNCVYVIAALLAFFLFIISVSIFALLNFRVVTAIIEEKERQFVPEDIEKSIAAIRSQYLSPPPPSTE